MIKRKSFKILILTLGLCLLFVPMTVSAKTTVKYCEGTEALIQTLNPGAWSFPDGNIHVRGMVNQYREQINCPEINGTNIVVMNANWDANFSGPMWGTTYQQTSYGDWEGTWSGKLNQDGTVAYIGVSRGVSGSVSGLILKVHGYTTEPDGVTQIEVTIRDPAGD